MSNGAPRAARTETPEHPGSGLTGDSRLADPANPLSALEHGATPDVAAAALHDAMRLEHVPVTADEG